MIRVLLQVCTPIVAFFCSLYGILLLGMSSLLPACQSPTPNPPPAVDTLSPTPVEAPALTPISGLPVTLVVRLTEATIHQAPQESAPVLYTAVAGDSLPFTNRITTIPTALVIDGLPYREPWLRVLLPNDSLGWIYGGAVQFNAQQQPALTKAVLYPRAQEQFGASLTQQMGIYRQEFQGVTTLPGFRTVYTRAHLLKDSLETLMTAYAQRTPKTVPNFFWLNELLPGFLVHYLPEKRRYYLFKTLTSWRQAAFQTVEPEDDAFIEVLLTTWATDSIAYYYYGWQLPVDGLGLCSLLGSGIHKNVLDQLELNLDSNSYFQPELQSLRQAVIYDISISTQYWMPLPAVLTELDSILAAPYVCLQTNDRIALNTKRQLLETPDAYQIAVNLFEGME